jgi:hypothetical protein
LALQTQTQAARADYQCATQSKGVEYAQMAPDPASAQSAAVSACQAAPTSDNNECSNNITCDQGFQTPAVSCATQSKGTEYPASSEFQNLAQLEAVGTCQQAGTSDNNECANSVVCQDQAAPAGSVALCTTTSAGLSFQSQSAYASLASGEAVDLCSANGQTNNNECTANASCNLVTPDAPPAAAVNPVVMITSLNGDYSPNHAAEIYVHPGDMITLSADLLDPTNNYQELGDSVEDFVWSAYGADPDSCDAASDVSCLSNSNFQVTDYGVTFYVPYDMGDSLQIVVESHNPAAVDANGNALTDTITLRNAAALDATYVPPTTVVTSPADYPYDHLDADLALAGQGRWVWIQGVRYFVPYSYVNDDGEEWRPYRHGYWNWDETYGWTWISYDPWGWMTDHYGVWRYHGVYGWVWMPFDDLHYEPHCVTWFDNGDYVGWYPYHASFTAGYVHGYNEGFRDGFEEGLNAGAHVSDGNYHSGYNVMHRRDVTVVNVYEVTKVTVINQTTVVTVVNGSMSGHSMSGYPGGDQHAARTFIESKAATPAPVTHTSTIATAGHAQFVQPTAQHPVPPEYQKVAGSATLHGAPTPVGSVKTVSSMHPEKPVTTVPPTSNGKALVPAPTAKDASGNTITLPPRAAKPAQPQNGNPLTGHKPVAVPPAPGHGIVQAPVYHPGSPTPPPVAPKPTPNHPAPVVQPKPLPPAPKPKPPTPAPHPIPVVTPTPHPQPTHSHTPIPVPTHTPIPVPTHTPIPVPTHTPIPVPTHTPIPVPTHTPIPVPTHHPEPAPAPAPHPAPAPAPVPPAPHPTPMPTHHHPDAPDSDIANIN